LLSLIAPDSQLTAAIGSTRPAIREVAVGLVRVPTIQQFTAVPYPAITFDSSVSRWVLLFEQAQAPTSGMWSLLSTSTADNGVTWASPAALPTLTPVSQGAGNAVFPSLVFDSTRNRDVVLYLEAADEAQRTWRPVVNFSATAGASWETPLSLMAASEPKPARASGSDLYSWTGFWANAARGGYFGDYTGSAFAGGVLYFAWTDSRSSTSSSNVIDVWGAELQLPR
jgi:hypothetical protein